MKKELSPVAVIGAVVGLVAVVVLVIFLSVRSDPAMRAPHAPPRFDPGAKDAESHSGPMSRGPNDPHPGAVSR